MSQESVKIYDTTLRDGNQARGISFSLPDKLQVTRQLDEFGIDYIEGGWPNPTNDLDTEYFKRIKAIKLQNAKVAAFASTRRPGQKCEDDFILTNLIASEAPVFTIFGKSWDIHATEVIKTSLDENLAMINESVAHLKKYADEVFYDAEHFFDGYKANREYALQTLKAAADAGADALVLCDTNGGMAETWELERIIKDVQSFVSTPLGIHVHNDTGTAVINSMNAVRCGAIQVQGTINGYGERCGNADLITIIPNLVFKMGIPLTCENNLDQLRSLSINLDDTAGLISNIREPYVGQAAFAHKGGAHIDGVMKVAYSFEHIDPSKTGNSREFIVSDQAGSALIVDKLQKIIPGIDKSNPAVKTILTKVKDLEKQGYHFETAAASFELLARDILGDWSSPVKTLSYRVIEEKKESLTNVSEATVKVQAGESVLHRVAEGDGPVNALDAALRLALKEKFPFLEKVKLDNFKVRVIDAKDGSAAKVRVWATFSNDKFSWETAGVSENIIQASWIALLDGLNYEIMKELQ